MKSYHARIITPNGAGLTIVVFAADLSEASAQVRVFIEKRDLGDVQWSFVNVKRA